jgi:hypothetical protein
MSEIMSDIDAIADRLNERLHRGPRGEWKNLTDREADCDAALVLLGRVKSALDAQAARIAEMEQANATAAREMARLTLYVDAFRREEDRADKEAQRADDLQVRAEAAEAERDRLLGVLEAAREFRDRGTVLTSCGRGPCQRVIEHEDRSDPQAKLYAALKALDTPALQENSNG